jgi:hypothetical protein
MLSPGQLADYSATGTRYITEEVQQYGSRIDREGYHQYQGDDEADHTGSFYDQTKCDNNFNRRNGPDQEGGPLIGKGLVVHFIDEALKIQELTCARIQKKNDDQG